MGLVELPNILHYAQNVVAIIISLLVNYPLRMAGKCKVVNTES